MPLTSITHPLRLLDALEQMALAGAELCSEQLVPRLLQLAAEATDSDMSSLWLYEPATNELVLQAHHGYSGPLAEKYRRIPADTTATGSTAFTLTARAVSLDEWPVASRADLRAEGFLENAIVSLHIEGRVVGSLNLTRRTPRRYSEGDLRAADVIGRHLKAHVENARLYAAERRTVEELKVLLNVGRALTTSLDVSEVLHTSAEALMRLLGSTGAAIALVEGTELIVAGASRPEIMQRIGALRLSLDGNTAVARVVRENRALSIRDAGSSPEVDAALAERLKVRGLLILPLACRNQVIGAALISDTRQPRQWTDKELEWAMIVASQVAIAVSNARLYDDLRRRNVELAKAQADLVDRERLAALGELSAVMAHEIRNPLGVFSNSLSRLRQVVSGGSEAEVLVGIMREEAERLDDIVGDLVDFARPVEPAVQTAALDALVADAVAAAQSVIAGVTAKVTVEAPRTLAPAHVDARMLRQGIINLVTNALHAAPSSGRVAVRVVEEPDHHLIEVTDDGPGIPADIVPRIFEPFFTTKARGSGLGLAVARRIAEAHGGTLDLRTGDTKGTTFVLRLRRPSA